MSNKYIIKKYSKDRIQELNKNKGFNLKIISSDKANYKIDIFENNQYLFSIGDKRYKDYPSYIEERGKKYANIRRELYHKRHGEYPIYTRGWFAGYLLW